MVVPSAGLHPLASVGAVDQPVGAVAERRHVRCPEDQGCTVADLVLDDGGHPSAGVIEDHPLRAGHGDRDEAVAVPRRGVERGQRPALTGGVRGIGEGAGRSPVHVDRQLPRVTPAGDQVEVDLVGLGAGDAVVVRPVRELAPRLVQRRVRIGTEAVGRREGGELLGVHEEVLDEPLGQLGVDVGHVLAGVDRVHVPGLRAQRAPFGQQLLGDRAEELAGQRAAELRPHVTGVPVAGDRGDPLVGGV